MRLVNVYRHEDRSIKTLYDLLRERTPDQSISHRQMPSGEQHVAFVKSRPYQCWYLIDVDGVTVGSIYLSKQREIGVFIFNEHKGKGYGKQAVELLMKQWPGHFLANINPANEASRKMFEKLGFNRIQETYRYG